MSRSQVARAVFYFSGMVVLMLLIYYFRAWWNIPFWTTWVVIMVAWTFMYAILNRFFPKTIYPNNNTPAI